MVDYNAALPQLQQAQAPNMLSMAEHLQKMQTSNMLMQQRAREVQKENALTEILGRSGGKATPDVIKGLIASGNYEPALALQRHSASMGAMGVQTQAAQTTLEEARLRMGETKRTLQVGAAARDYISGNDDLTNPDALKKLRQTNPDAYEAITKFNGLNAKMTYEASTAKRLDDKAKLDLMQGTASLFAPAFATAQTPEQYTKLYDQLAKVYDISSIASRDFTQDNVRNLVQTGTSAHDLEAVTIGGRPAIRNKRTGQIQLSETGAPGDNAAMPTQTAAAMPPVAAGTSPMAPTVDNALALGRPGTAPVAPGVNALARPAQQTVEQILAAEQEGKDAAALAQYTAKRRADIANPMPEAGYRFTAEGAQEPVPGGPASAEGIIAKKGAETTAAATAKEVEVKAAKKEAGQNLLRTVGGDNGAKIEALIKASTSGRMQKYAAETVGAFGSATTGMENIAKLDQLAKQMTFDLLNGKLGANISNEDRKFIMGLVADIAAPETPQNERISGFKQLKNTVEAWANGKDIEIGAPAGKTQKPPEPKPATNGRLTTPSRPPLSSFGGG